MIKEGQGIRAVFAPNVNVSFFNNNKPLFFTLLKKIKLCSLHALFSFYSLDEMLFSLLSITNKKFCCFQIDTN
jgi:hypothetical protein